MEEVVLKAEPRQVVGKQVKALRREGGLPAVLYGQGIQPIPVTLDAREASRTLATITSSQLITIDVDGDRHTTLVREKQRHPVRGNLLHVDFMVVSLTEKLHATVGIVGLGEAPAVENEGGLLMQNLNEVEVESLPGDLPTRIEVDLSTMTEIGSQITVADLQVPRGVSILTVPEDVVFVVTAPAVEVEEEAAEEVVEEGEEPEVIERGKREGEEDF